MRIPGSIDEEAVSKGYAQIATQRDFDAFQQNLYSFYNDNVLTLDAYLDILYLNGGVLYGNN